ncbi:MAG: NADPH-dependent 7-cyano-7-deazaguanine reductase QueF [Pseudomonadota bacterium]
MTPSSQSPHHSPLNSPLGKSSAYVDQYDASLLFPIPRVQKRAEIGLADTKKIPFMGADLWTAFELSWLNLRGKPQIAIAHFTIPSESTHIIESKSFKLYLNSFNNTRFENVDAVKARLRADVTEAIWRGTAAGIPQTSIGLTLVDSHQFDAEPIHEMDGVNLDRLDLDCLHYTPTPELLTATRDEAPVSEVLVSNLLKSNCLVTGQPDWASVQIHYTGDQINQEGLLQYLVSFRNHNEFHEQCVERIFMDIWTRCKPIKLAVYARYTRRGGLDINPFRTSYVQKLPRNIRTARQ